MSTRFGIGYDSHAFGAARALKLGGVEIPYDSGLSGHSDGDAVAHALTDALFGAAALGDIGRHFPDSDPRWKDADSLAMLATAAAKVRERGYEIVNVDATVVTEAPKLAAHIPEMRAKVAEALGLPVDAVSVKGKSNEGMDAVGRGEGLAVIAVAAIARA